MRAGNSALPVALLTFATMAVVCAIDLMLPLGVAGAVLYVIPVLASARSGKPRAVVVTAVACITLTLVGQVWSPPAGGTESWKVLANRAITMLAILAATLCGLTSLRRRAESPAPHPRGVFSRVARFASRRTVAPLALVFVAGGAVLALHQWRIHKLQMETAAIEDARSFARTLTELRTMYSSEVVERVRPFGISVTPDYHDMERAIPLPATLTMQLGERLRENYDSGAQIRLYSPFPFPGRENGGLADDFAHDAWKALNDDPRQPFYRFEDLAGCRTIRFAVADVMRQSCIDCHNNHPQTMRNDWKLGDVRGVLEVALPLNHVVVQGQEAMRQTIGLFVALAAVAVAALAIVINRLRRVSDELEVKVEQRTGEIRDANAALERANQELADTNEELDEFAYAASHDLKSPLAAIGNLARWIEEDAGPALPGECRGHLRLMTGRVQRLERLLDDLLEYSRAGRQRAEVDTVDTAEMARDMFALVRPPDALVLTVADDMPVLRTFRAPLEQVFRNLISNAVKHHDRPQGRIEIGCVDRGELVEFFVADDGPGVAEQYRQRIFRMFQTLRPRDEVEGSGMGLALVKRVVERQGGKIWIDPATGGGTTVRFTWPKSVEPKAQNDKPKGMTHG